MFDPNVPDILIFAHRVGPMYAWMQAAIAKLAQESYNQIYVFDPSVTAHAACNIALRRSRSRFPVIMDDDCVPLLPKFLSEMRGVLQRHDDVACVTPFEVKTPEDIRKVLKNPDYVVEKELDGTPKYRTLELTWTATYCTMLDREKMPDLYEDENMPGSVAMCDVDLCFQVRSAGYRVAYTNLTTVYHPIKSMDPRWRDKWKAVPKEEIEPMVKKQQEYMFRKWGSYYLANMGMRALGVIE